MEKLMKTSKTVDTILKVVFKILQVAGIIILVGAGICLAGEFVGWEPDSLVSSCSLGDVEFQFTEPQQVDMTYIVMELIITFLLADVVIAITCYLITILRRILTPMIAGQPFDGTVSRHMKKLGIVIIVNTIIVSICNSIASSISFYMFFGRQDMSNIILSDAVERVTVNHSFDITGVLIGVLALMLAHVFRYGEELQKQADETL